MLKESEKCDWKEVQTCHVSHNCVGNSAVLPLLKGSSVLVRDKGSEKNLESCCKSIIIVLLSSRCPRVSAIKS